LEKILADQNQEPPKEQLRSAFEKFVTEAYRGNPSPEGLIDRLIRIYDSFRGLGNPHREALKQSLATVLSSPQFLYRAEPDPQAPHRKLTGLELATRLSYFIWGAPPDATLRELALSGELLQTVRAFSPSGQVAPTCRKSAQFVKPFLNQWLLLDRIDLFQFSQQLYPNFDDSMKAAARQEVYATFTHLLKENAPLGDLLKADYVIVNAMLAEYYGMEGVTGDEFRKGRKSASRIPSRRSSWDGRNYGDGK